MPALAIRTTEVFFHDSHPFEDDHRFPVTRYQYWISVHDSARDEERQLAIAQRVFDAAKAQDWPAMLSFNLQGSRSAPAFRAGWCRLMLLLTTPSVSIVVSIADCPGTA